MAEAEIDLDNLIAESGDFLFHVLPRNSRLLDADEIDAWEWRNFERELEDEIGLERIEALASGASPTQLELKLLISEKIRSAFENPDDDVTPGLWFADYEDAGVLRIAAILCWGAGWETDRRLFGLFDSRDEAMKAVTKEYMGSP